MSFVILGLIGLVIVLASFLLITRRAEPEILETPSSKAWDSTPLPSYSPAEMPAYEQTAQPQPPQAQPDLMEQPVPNQGPPLPATGLPEDGQWNSGPTTENNISLQIKPLLQRINRHIQCLQHLHPTQISPAYWMIWTCDANG